MTVAIVDYGSGNLRSAARGFEKCADEPVLVTDDPEAVRRADRVVLPGQGAFGVCMAGLEGIDGMVDAIGEAVRERARPFFGICVGMQLMAQSGREHGGYPGLGWLDGEVVPVEPDDPGLKIPHMGWNTLDVAQPHPVLEGVEADAHVYFVHSYHFAVGDTADLAATTDYAGRWTAAVARDNLFGTQFHPEKSQRTGLRMIENFMQWQP